MLKWHQSNRVFFPTQIMQAEKGKDLRIATKLMGAPGAREENIVDFGGGCIYNGGRWVFLYLYYPVTLSKEEKVQGALSFMAEFERKIP